MPGYFSHSHQIRWVRNIFIICVRADVVALSCTFVSSVISIKRKSVKVISLFLASHGERTIYIFFGDESCIYLYSSAHCNFRRRTCILPCDSFYIDAQREQIIHKYFFDESCMNFSSQRNLRNASLYFSESFTVYSSRWISKFCSLIFMS